MSQLNDEARLKAVMNLSGIGKKFFNFQFENISRLNDREIVFISALMSKSFIHEKALLIACGGEIKRIQECIDKAAESLPEDVSILDTIL